MVSVAALETLSVNLARQARWVEAAAAQMEIAERLGEAHEAYEPHVAIAGFLMQVQQQAENDPAISE